MIRTRMHSSRMRTARLLTDPGGGAEVTSQHSPSQNSTPSWNPLQGTLLHRDPLLRRAPPPPRMTPHMLRMAPSTKDGTPAKDSTPLLRMAPPAKDRTSLRTDSSRRAQTNTSANITSLQLRNKGSVTPESDPEFLR